MTKNCVIALEGKVGTNGDTENRFAWAVHTVNPLAEMESD